MEDKRNGWYTDNDGTRRHCRDGVIHREDDPAVIDPSGFQYWSRNGQFHREDGPAVIYPDGSLHWWLYGILHREDGPAIIRDDGSQEWHLNGKEVRMETVLNTPEKREAYLLEESLRRL
jgi:hypothetical protein